ncbi:MAG: LpxL/LpxP family acyltransferase, partial [Planctomycetota bacterium]
MAFVEGNVPGSSSLVAFSVVSALRLLGMLPLGLARGVGSTIGAVQYLLRTRYYRFSRVNVDACWPQLPAAERERLVRKSMLQIARTYTEMGAIRSWPPPKLARLTR